jgi:hypothetical protein
MSDEQMTVVVCREEDHPALHTIQDPFLLFLSGHPVFYETPLPFFSMNDISYRDMIPAEESYQLYSSGPIDLHQTPRQPSHLLLLFAEFTLLWASCYYIVCITIGYSVWPKRGSPLANDYSNSPSPSSSSSGPVTTIIKSEPSSSSEGMMLRMTPERSPFKSQLYEHPLTLLSSNTATPRKIQSPCLDAILSAAITYPSPSTALPLPIPSATVYNPVTYAKLPTPVRSRTFSVVLPKTSASRASIDYLKTSVAPWQPNPGELVMRLRPPSCVLTGSPDEMVTHDGPFVVNSSHNACPKRLTHIDPDGLSAWVEFELPDISRAERWWKNTDLLPYEGKTTASELRDAWVPRGGFYLVKRIRAERRRKGRLEYRISWKGWPSEDDTWEWPESIEGLEEVLEEWEARKVKWGITRLR